MGGAEFFNPPPPKPIFAEPILRAILSIMCIYNFLYVVKICGSYHEKMSLELMLKNLFFP